MKWFTYELEAADTLAMACMDEAMARRSWPVGNEMLGQRDWRS